MGIYDRGYYDGDQWKGGGQTGTGGFSGPSAFKRSAIAAIIAINVLVFLVDMFSPAVTRQRVVQDPGGAPQVEEIKGKQQQVSMSLALKCNLEDAGLPGPADNPIYVFQFLTHGFAHASIGEEYGLLHIAFNMLMLLFLGMPVEQKYGREEFVKFYLIALLFAGGVWFTSKMISDTPAMAVGASGAVAAVVILFILNYPKQTLLLMGIIPMPAWVVGLLLLGIDVLNSLNSESRIAVEAHFGGAAFAAMYFFGKWNFGWLKFSWLTDRFSGKPRLKVHSVEESADLSRQADAVLDKVHRLGEESLSRKERKVLERYSKTVRKSRDD